MLSLEQNEKMNDALNYIKELYTKYPNDSSGLKEKLVKLIHTLIHPSYNMGVADQTTGQIHGSFEAPRLQNESERKKIDQRLHGFHLNNSKAWKAICERFGPNLNQCELLSIAEVLCHEINSLSRNIPLKIDREAKRRKEVLIKWFDENYNDIDPHLKTMILEDENGDIIDSRRY